MMQEQGMPEMPADLSNLAGADGMPDMAAIQDLANKMKIGGENAAAPVQVGVCPYCSNTRLSFSPTQAPVTASVTEATEFEEKDIELVMNQVECSRDAAIKGLQNNDGDVVNTIMDLVGSGKVFFFLKILPILLFFFCFFFLLFFFLLLLFSPLQS